jgi:hypothetical protein
LRRRPRPKVGCGAKERKKKKKKCRNALITMWCKDVIKLSERFRVLHNEKLGDRYGLCWYIARTVKPIRLRWAGHVARMGEINVKKNIGGITSSETVPCNKLFTHPEIKVFLTFTEEMKTAIQTEFNRFS